MQHEFYSVAIPETRHCLGLKLRPLSLGHIILLHRIESAFLCDSKVDYKELSIAALICSLKYQDALDAIQDPETAKFLTYLGEKITGVREWLVRLGFRKPRPIDLVAHTLAISEYIKEASKLPLYGFNPGDFKEMDLPQVQIVRVTVMREMNIADDEIMDRSWALCLWDYFTIKALKGEITIENRDQFAHARAVADRMAEIVAKREAKG
jgi:hypothetical protein